MSAEQQPKDRWQRKVALATNAGGAVAGPAALWMAIRQAKAKEGGMPTQAATAIAEKRPNSPTWGKGGRVLRVLRNPKAVAAGGVTAVGLQAANWAGDATATYELERQKRLQHKKEPAVKSFHEVADYSYPVERGTGHGQSLVSKRTFDAEADRQRRLGTYAGLGLGGGVVLGDAARRRLQVTRYDENNKPITREKIKEGRQKARAAALKSGKKAEMPVITRGLKHVGSGKTLAALAGGAALSTAGGVAAYRRGISERNQPWR